MRVFQIVNCHTVVHPEDIRVNAVDLLEDEIQKIADNKPVREDRPAIGELTFRHFVKDEGFEVHAFFIDKHGKKRRFMKAIEIDPEEDVLDKQYDLITAECGKDAADKANYGWGVMGDDTYTSVATKVYGHGVLESQIDHSTWEITHRWS